MFNTDVNFGNRRGQKLANIRSPRLTQTVSRVSVETQLILVTDLWFNRFSGTKWNVFVSVSNFNFADVLFFLNLRICSLRR